MNNEQILMAVVVVAVMAIVLRIAIRRETGGAINWPKIMAIMLSAGIFIGTFFATDPYRIETWREGAATASECRMGHVMGRAAGEGVVVSDSITRIGLPLHFAVNIDSVGETGYWRRRSADRTADLADREVQTSDSGRVAIRRSSRNFAVTRHPANEADYLPVWRLSLHGGQKVLAVMPKWQAKNGTSPIVTTRAIEGGMSNICKTDSTVLDEVFLLGFDDQRAASNTVSYVLYKAAAATLATLVVLILFGLWNRKRDKK